MDRRSMKFCLIRRNSRKIRKLQRFEENFRLLKEKLMQAEKILEEASHELSEIRKEYSKQLDEKIIEGLKELNFEDVDFSIRFDRRKIIQIMVMMRWNMRFPQIQVRAENRWDRSYPVVSFPGLCLPSKRSLQIKIRSIH